MSIADNNTTVQGRLNQPSPGQLPTHLQELAFGDMLRVLKTDKFHRVPAASPYTLGTTLAVVLPDNAKATAILRAHVRASTSVALGPLVPDQVIEGAPAGGHIGISPSGDIVTLASDGVTDLDVTYEPLKVDVVEYNQLPVVPGTGVVTMPGAILDAQGRSMLVILMEAEALAGGTAGKKIVDVAGAATSAGKARLTAAKDGVSFAVADAVTSCRVKLGLIPAVDVDALLESQAITP